MEILETYIYIYRRSYFDAKDESDFFLREVYIQTAM